MEIEEKPVTQPIRRRSASKADRNLSDPIEYTVGSAEEMVDKLMKSEITAEETRWPKEVDMYKRRINADFKFEGKLCGEMTFNESAEKCIICGKNDDHVLYSCQGLMNGFTNNTISVPLCKSKFHYECIKDYNASDYHIRYIALPECQNKLLCPLHFCDVCYLERNKQTAFKGDLVECALCFRAYHAEQCTPIGSQSVDVTMKLDENFKTRMLICSAHRPKKEVHSHIAECCECKDKEKLTRCPTCIRSFHKECRVTKSIGGVPIDTNSCEYCLTGETVGMNSKVTAKWRGKFYEGIVRDWSWAPEKLKKSTLFGELGYCLIQWSGSSVQYSIAVVDHCAPMSVGWSKLSGENRNARELRDVTFPSMLKPVGRRLDTAKYLEKGDEKVYIKAESDTYACTCATKIGNHCTTASCSNVRDNYECSPHCSEENAKCMNRGISEKRPHPLIERKETATKGYGVFANGHISKGEFIAEYSGEILNRKEFEKRNKLVSAARDDEANLYMVQMSHGRVVDAARAGNIARYINHSCDPNCRIECRQVIVKQSRKQFFYDERVAVVAIRDIEPGEEISFEYLMQSQYGTKAPVCKCGAPNCKRTLGEVKDGDIVEICDEDEKEKENLAKKNEKKRGTKRKAQQQQQVETASKRRPSEQASLNIPEVFQKFADSFDGNSAEKKKLIATGKQFESLEYQAQFLNNAFLTLIKYDDEKMPKLEVEEIPEEIPDVKPSVKKRGRALSAKNPPNLTVSLRKTRSRSRTIPAPPALDSEILSDPNEPGPSPYSNPDALPPGPSTSFQF
ncbi:unnamed protein product [Caenorhabditis angaria]|uniref:Histone-lysine N-methyltransferase n=1 Tax=Caenorhabditis angaria TaxID=860376 RepID=A0A9P1IA71_9PELO|nr:unnamed protein product [Caenorhabditis angaria]